MQETEVTESIPAEAAYRSDLDLSYLIPEWLQPIWDFFTPYPGLLTLLLIFTAWFGGKLLKMVIARSLMQLVKKTANEVDDQLIQYLTRPLVLTTVTLAMMLAVTAYPLPQSLHDASLSVLATILLVSWLRAGLNTAHTMLELLASNQHRIEIVQERTIPVFDMTIKILLVGMAAYIFLLI